MLLNILKIRYGDAPVFLEVSSIINQYALLGEINASASWNALLPTDSQSLGARGTYAERPTITYNPIMGKQFALTLMNPIPPVSILSLIQAGWSVEFLFAIGIKTVNGISNGSGLQMVMREPDPDWVPLLKAFSGVQRAGGLGLRIEKRKEGEVALIFFPRELKGKLAREVAEVRRLLRLDPKANEYRLVYGALANDEGEIAILTRSMLEIMVELATRVEVPTSHIRENRASPGVYGFRKSTREAESRVRIRSSSERPDDPFVAVKYRGYWFYIDDRDFNSKRTFSFLMFLFTLAETGAPEKVPVITIPAG
ncbi:MAG: hypothetical protein JRJ29_00890 [Deltaproteobacteria bacterium]|nr:hypothetical protein [Deltaproteobacteria bacterium]